MAAVFVLGWRMVLMPEAMVAKAASSSSRGPARASLVNWATPAARSTSASGSASLRPGAASASTCSRSVHAAAFTAGPMVAAVRDAPCTGAAGRSVSPSTTVTWSTSSPSSSAATIAISVAVPDPISCVAHATSAVPSACSVARTAAWLR